jgi:hypothetical protein
MPPQLYRIYSNLYQATKKSLHCQGMGHIDLTKYKLKQSSATDNDILKAMHKLSCILKHPEFAHMSKHGK